MKDKMDIRDYEYVLIPNILLKYKCSSSGECCQSKWKIDIDKKSYEKTKMNLAQVNENIETYMTKEETEDQYLTKFENGYCKFITKEKLCRIHKEFGWECLSDTCKVYPRHLKLTTRGVEVGITFSCPSAAKLLLTEENFEILKVKKNEFFFMKPSSMSFLIPENNLKTDFGFRYYEIEEMLIDILKSSRNIGEKLSYILLILNDIIERDIQEVDFKNLLKDFDSFEYKEDLSLDMEKILGKIMSAKKDRSSTVYFELMNLFKFTKLNGEIKEDREMLKKETYFLTDSDIKKLKNNWNSKYERILNNYILCLIFEKDIYYNMEYALFKIVILAMFLKLRLLLNTKYVQRELNEQEIIDTIKYHDNDFGHDMEFFRVLYNEDLGVSKINFITKLITILN